ncbi:hypothetical protein LguiA_005082 [Lonicera macranthoides]
MGPFVLSQPTTGLGVLAKAYLVKSVMDQNPMAGLLGGPHFGSSILDDSAKGTPRGGIPCTSRWSMGGLSLRGCTHTLALGNKLRSLCIIEKILDVGYEIGKYEIDGQETVIKRLVPMLICGDIDR